jgi:AAA+ ATPase superfamily predicted ATPase
MTNKNIIGRKPQVDILQKAMASDEAEFIAVYGRRRVGKTFLVREFFGDGLCFELTGMLEGSLADQLANFSDSLTKATGAQIPLKVPESWREAFLQLQQFLDTFYSSNQGAKRVIFLDELPWLNTPRSKFIGALQHFWNTFGSKRKDLILVVCGSAASWMISQVVRSRGGLHNRLTRQIRLLPFNLAETREYLRNRGMKNLSNYSILQIYMSLGGVPYYLSKIEPGCSPAQIIDALCFSETGPFRNEYDQLYGSLFAESGNHLKVVEFLAKRRTGFSRTEILNGTGMKSGGTTSAILEELEESGFIGSYIPFGKKAKDALYRLTDEFSLFHHAWIKPLGKQNPGKDYWITRQSLPKYKSWAGYSFEGICMKHTGELKTALGIAKVATEESPWRYIPKAGQESSGVQIDLLIDRADGVINLCEMKFYTSEFILDAGYASELRRKIEIFKEQTGTRKSIFLTLITTFGVNENMHSTELEVVDLPVDRLFDVPVS